jgi:H+/Cl- antiporter ClcA
MFRRRTSTRLGRTPSSSARAAIEHLLAGRNPLARTRSYITRNREEIAEISHHNPYSLEDSAAAEEKRNAMASLDFDEPFSDIHSLASLQRPRLWVSFCEACTFAAVGVSVGLLAFAIQQGVGALTALRVETARSLLSTDHVGAAFACWLGLALAYGFASALMIVCIEPAAAGSGIPEVKAFLNGTNVPRFLTPRALLVKTIGVCLSVSAGLVIGREGPLIHIGAVTGNVLSSLPKLRRLALFRSDRAKRDFVSTGAAAGVAGAFASPVGGICFALEEAASYWRL